MQQSNNQSPTTPPENRDSWRDRNVRTLWLPYTGRSLTVGGGRTIHDDWDAFSRSLFVRSGVNEFRDPVTGGSTDYFRAPSRGPAQGQPDAGMLWRPGPNGEPIPLNKEAADALKEGGQLPPFRAAGVVNPDNPDEIEYSVVLDTDGTVLSQDPEVAKKKFEDAVEKAYSELLLERERNGITSPVTPDEVKLLKKQAENMALRASQFWIGGNADNFPKNYAGQFEYAEYDAGMLLPGFNLSGQERPLTADEARLLNLIQNSGAYPEDERDARMMALFSPFVDVESKQAIFAEALQNEQILEANSLNNLDDHFQWGDPGFLGVKWLGTIPRAIGHVVTDYILPGVSFIYEDVVDPSATWAMSALPGGPRTASWQEAQSISTGQMANTLLGRAGPMFGLGAVASASRSVFDQEYRDELGQVFRQGGFLEDPNDIYNSEIRRRTFEESSVGSTISGGMGLSVSLVWDPLILIGPVAKGLRVSHRVGIGAGSIKSGRDVQFEVTKLKLAGNSYRPFDEARDSLRQAEIIGDAELISRAQENLRIARAAKNEELKNASPTALFVDWVLDPAGGATTRSATEILNHAVVNRLAVSGDVALALSRARTFEEAALVMRYGFGDPTALTALRARSASIADDLARAQVDVQIDNLATSPDKFAKAQRKVEKEIDQSIAEVNRLETLALSEAPRRAAVAAQSAEEVQGSVARLNQVMLEEGSAQIDRLNAALKAARAENAPQGVIDDIWRQLDAAADLSNDAVFGRITTGLNAPEEVRAAWTALRNAMDRQRILDEAQNIRIDRTPEQMAATAARLDDFVRQNEMVQAALRTDLGFMQGNAINFGRGRLQGAARMRERSRQSKAERRSFQKATHRSGFQWVPETFRMSSGESLTVWGAAKGVAGVARDAATRPFTYMGMESPANYMKVKGIGGQENYREGLAILNNLKMYSGRRGMTPFVNKAGDVLSAAERKTFILERLQRNAGNSRLDPIRAVEKFEKDIIRDMVRFYTRGMDPADARRFEEEIRDMYHFFDNERALKIEQVKTRNYWQDESGGFHKSAYLESQLVDSIPLMDFRRLERLVEKYAKGYSGGKALSITGGSESAAMRQGIELGRQRLSNAEARAERARAALDELAPTDDELAALRAAAKEGDKAATARLKAIDKAEKLSKKSQQSVKMLSDELDRALENQARATLAAGPIQKLYDRGLGWYDQFQVLWRASVLFRLAYPVRNTIEGTTRRIAYEASLVPVIQDAVRGSRNIAQNLAEGRSTLTRTKKKDARAEKAREAYEKTGQLPRAVRRWADREDARLADYRANQVQFRDDMAEELEQLRAMRSQVPAEQLDEFDVLLLDTQQSLKNMDNAIEQIDLMRRPFSSDARPADIILEYRRSLDRPRQVGDEFVFGVDGRQYWGLYNDPHMASVMKQNASGRETVQTTAGLRLSTTRSVVRAARLVGSGEVAVTSPNYFAELANALNRQVKNSLVGGQWVRGRTPEQAAREIMSPRGATFRQLREIDDYDDALAAALDAFREFERYAPNPQVRTLLASGEVSEPQLVKLLRNDEYADRLVNIHGQQLGDLAGSRNQLGLTERLNRRIEQVYNVIGTGVEDTFVRLPFAQRRYKDSLETSMRVLNDLYPGNTVPGWAVESAIQASRRRAIKETKDYLYTQDRRTNFGRVMERWVPFASAWQNSVLAFSKLLKMNPEMAYYGSQAWRAPERVGVADENGDIRIPIPAFLVDKSVTLPFGGAEIPITGMWGDEWVYSKQSVAVLPQMIDPTLTFRATPLVQASASALMQAGFFSTVSPSVLTAIPGLSEETAQTLWDHLMVGTFGTTLEGDEPRIGTMFLGVDKILPPSAQKWAQVIMTRFGNSPENNMVYASHYTRIALEELLKQQRGEREDLPTRAEVRNKANGLFLIRGLTNMTGVTGGPLGFVTPPQIDSDIAAMREAKRLLDDMMGGSLAGDKAWVELFGDEALRLVNYRSSRNVGGIPATRDAMRRAEQNKDLITAIAPRIEESPNMLGFLVSNGSETDDDYSDSVRQLQMFRDIPGLNRQWRDRPTPEQAIRASRVDAGWVLYDQAIGALRAELEARGLSTWTQAPDLRQERSDFLDAMSRDIETAPWWEEWIKGGQTRTGSAIALLRTATKDKNYMDKYGSDPREMWATARMWLQERERYFREFKAVDGNQVATSAIREGWAERSALLAETNLRFRQFWMRYLEDDDFSSGP